MREEGGLLDGPVLLGLGLSIGLQLGRNEGFVVLCEWTSALRAQDDGGKIEMLGVGQERGGFKYAVGGGGRDGWRGWQLAGDAWAGQA